MTGSTGSSAAPSPLARPRARCALALLAALLAAGAAGAQEAHFAAKQEAFRDLLRAREQGNERAAAIQKQIDEVADETDALAAQYRTTQKQVASIREFNQRMRDLIETQEAELASVGAQLDRVEGVGRSVTPLMLRMIEALEEFVELDMPFLPKERAERLASLRAVMNRADVTSASKYRFIMEAYQVENEYGRTIESYRDQMEIDGRLETVDVLRFGRIALVYQTLDGSHSGVWSQETRSWLPLGPDSRAPVGDAIRIARKLVPPDLIRLPLPPPKDPSAALETAAP